MLFRTLAFTAGLAITCSTASAATLSENFNAGSANGFGVINGGTGSVVNGGPGGATDPYFSIVDIASGFMQMTFGTDWIGDLTAYDGGLFEIDYIQTEQARGGYIESFGTLLLTGAGRTIGADVIANDPTDAWQSTSAILNAAAFGVTEAIWQEVLADITVFAIRAESWSNPSETVGFDNITLTGTMAPVPLPAGGLLLLGGLAAVAGLRRRRVR